MDNNNGFPILKSENYILRRITQQDVEAIFSYFSDEEVTKYYDLEAFTDISDAYRFVTSKEKMFFEGRGIRWGITMKDQRDRVIGTIGFHNWNRSFFKAEISYELSKEYWGQGLMSEVLSCVLEYGFESMELNRIEAILQQENIGSKRVLEKANFKHEGTLEEYVFLKGRFIDTEIMALLKKNFRKNVDRSSREIITR
ncbi:MAG TPA: GNAT family N-acetyltransferase [Bacillus sp. (in: firmicutes)]|nr:GNAT family N-acetyltransferase [Bacillus sp. (in: firmicutes)]